jgi:hypothetical protein
MTGDPAVPITAKEGDDLERRHGGLSQPINFSFRPYINWDELQAEVALPLLFLLQGECHF